jgi:hypothetical protein
MLFRRRSKAETQQSRLLECLTHLESSELTRKQVPDDALRQQLEQLQLQLRERHSVNSTQGVRSMLHTISSLLRCWKAS